MSYLEELVSKNPARAVAFIILLLVFGMAGIVLRDSFTIIRDQRTINERAAIERDRNREITTDHEIRLRIIERSHAEILARLISIQDALDQNHEDHRRDGD